MPHARIHVIACEGCLSDIDVIAGRWIASSYAPNSAVRLPVIGTDDDDRALDT
jgi:hypothetical protein